MEEIPFPSPLRFWASLEFDFGPRVLPCQNSLIRHAQTHEIHLPGLLGRLGIGPLSGLIGGGPRRACFVAFPLSDAALIFRL